MAASFLTKFRSPKLLSNLKRGILISNGNFRQTSSAVTFREALNSSDFKVTTLPNHLRVASEDLGCDATTVGLWFYNGSRFETEKNNGVSRLYENLIFTGNEQKSHVSIETQAKNQGISIHTALSREHLAIFAKCLPKDLPAAVELLSELIKNFYFTESNVERQKENLINQLEASDEDLATVVMDYLHSTAYQGSPLSRSILGNTSSLRSLGVKEVEDHYITCIKPHKTVLAAAGGVDHNQLHELAEKYLSSFGSPSPSLSNPPPSRFTGSEIRARYDDEPFLHFALAVEGPGWGSEDSLILQVISSLVGSWDQSIIGGKNLANHVAFASSSANLCQAYKSFYLQYINTGLWGIYGICNKLTVEDFFYNFQKDWMRICTSSTEFELERIKNQMKISLFGNFHDSTSMCDTLAKEVLFLGRKISYEEIYSRLNSITPATIRDVAYKYLYDKCPAMASYGPTEQLPEYNRVRSSMWWLRF